MYISLFLWIFIYIYIYYIQVHTNNPKPICDPLVLEEEGEMEGGEVIFSPIPKGDDHCTILGPATSAYDSWCFSVSGVIRLAHK